MNPLVLLEHDFPVLRLDGPAVGGLFTLPVHFTAQHDSPRLEEMIVDVHDPLDVGIELLSFVPLDALPVLGRNLLAPQPRLTLRGSIVVDEERVAVLRLAPHEVATLDAHGKPHRLAQRIGDGMQFIYLEAHAPVLREPPQVRNLIGIERGSAGESPLEGSGVAHLRVPFVSEATLLRTYNIPASFIVDNKFLLGKKKPHLLALGEALFIYSG